MCLFQIFGRTDAKAESPIFWPPDENSQLIGKNPDAGKEWKQQEEGAAEDEMARQQQRLNGHEFEPTLGDSEGPRNLACCSLRSHKELDTTSVTTEQQQMTILNLTLWGTAKLFPTVAVPFYISTIYVWGFLLLHIISKSCYFPFFNYSHPKWSSAGEDGMLSLWKVALSAGENDSMFWPLWKTPTYKLACFLPLVFFSLHLHFHLLNLFSPLLPSPEGDKPSRFTQDCPMIVYNVIFHCGFDLHFLSEQLCWISLYALAGHLYIFWKNI